MLRERIRVLLLAAGVCFGGTAHAQASSDVVYHLHGSVLNGATGRPIGHALVESADRRLATMTNSDGNWSLDVSVPPPTQAGAAEAVSSQIKDGPFEQFQSGSSVHLIAQRPGYLPDDEQTSVALTADASDAGITLRLMPASVIRGSVALPAPAEHRGISLQLLRRGAHDGRLNWLQVGGTQVRGDGTFRIGDLGPGEYTVLLTTFDSAFRASNSGGSGEKHVPPTFLGDTVSLQAATRLRIGYGETVQADLHPQAVPYYAVTVPVTGLAQDGGVNARVDRNDESFGNYFFRWDGRTGKVEGSLPSGDYTLRLQSFGPQAAAATVPLHVADGPLQLTAVTMTPTLRIPIRVRDERSRPGDSAGARSQSASAQATASDFNLTLDAVRSGPGPDIGKVTGLNGSAALENVVPGTYWAASTAYRGYVAALTSGGTDLLHDPLVVTNAGADPIEVTLRDDTGTVVVTENGSEAEVTNGRLFALLLPVNAPAQTMLPASITYGVPSTIVDVPPGTYRAVLVSQRTLNAGIPYRDTAAMDAMAARGADVTVQPGQTSNVTLSAAGTLADQP